MKLKIWLLAEWGCLFTIPFFFVLITLPEEPLPSLTFTSLFLILLMFYLAKKCRSKRDDLLMSYFLAHAKINEEIEE